MRIPEHPIIRNMERYGYPEPPPLPVLCAECEQGVYEGETLYSFNGNWICPECFIDAITEFVKWKTEEFAAEYGHDTKEVVCD